jgi:hypothetical protein
MLVVFVSVGMLARARAEKGPAPRDFRSAG